MIEAFDCLTEVSKCLMGSDLFLIIIGLILILFMVYWFFYFKKAYRKEMLKILEQEEVNRMKWRDDRKFTQAEVEKNGRGEVIKDD